MFGLEILNLSPEVAFAVGVFVGLIIALAMYADGDLRRASNGA